MFDTLLNFIGSLLTFSCAIYLVSTGNSFQRKFVMAYSCALMPMYLYLIFFNIKKYSISTIKHYLLFWTFMNQSICFLLVSNYSLGFVIPIFLIALMNLGYTLNLQDYESIPENEDAEKNLSTV